MTEQAVTHIATRGFDPVYGARPLKRYLQRQVETQIGRAILTGDVAEGCVVIADEIDGDLSVIMEQDQAHSVGA